MPIRQYRPFADTFAAEFQESLLYSPMSLEDLIQWQNIDSAVETKAEVLPVIENDRDPEKFFNEEFVRHEDAGRRCEILFELLGFEHQTLLSRESKWDLTEVTFSNEGENPREELAEHLARVGADNLLQSRDKIKGHLEQFELSQNGPNFDHDQTQDSFDQLIGDELRRIQAAMQTSIRLVSEDRISGLHLNTGERRFDYIIYKDNEPQIVVETNYFQSIGSKAYELMRSYDILSTKLRNSGIEFVWIIDGKGWEGLADAIEKVYKTIVDIYNRHQAETLLEEDIREFLHSGPAVGEEEVQLSRETSLQDFE